MKRKLMWIFCKLSRRYKFRQICKAIGIKAYPWQKEYALTKYPILRVDFGRRSGKTMAVMLRALMNNVIPPVAAMDDVFNADPDYLKDFRSRKMWYFDEYQRLYYKCVSYGIPMEPAVTLDRRFI